MKQIKRKNKELGSIEGLHTLTTSDIRYSGAQRLEQEILKYINESQQLIDRIQSSIYRLKSQFILDESEEVKKQIEALNLEKRMRKNEKHNTLEQMYQEMFRLGGVNQHTVHNIIPTAGRHVVALWFIGDNTYDADLGANYGSVGSSNTAVANGDTQLTTETFRKARSSEATSTNVAILSNFYSASDFTGTVEEAGWHIHGGAGANTGQLLSHFLTGTTVKSATETLIVQSTLTIS